MHTNVGSRKCVNTPIWQGFAKALKKIVFGQVLQNVPKHYFFQRFWKTLDLAPRSRRLLTTMGENSILTDFSNFGRGIAWGMGLLEKVPRHIFFRRFWKCGQTAPFSEHFENRPKQPHSLKFLHHLGRKSILYTAKSFWQHFLNPWEKCTRSGVWGLVGGGVGSKTNFDQLPER